MNDRYVFAEMKAMYVLASKLPQWPPRNFEGTYNCYTMSGDLCSRGAQADASNVTWHELYFANYDKEFLIKTLDMTNQKVVLITRDGEVITISTAFDAINILNSQCVAGLLNFLKIQIVGIDDIKFHILGMDNNDQSRAWRF